MAMKKYETLADELESLVRNGTLLPGERMPSVRRTVQMRGVSPSTVFEAYYLLERRGVIEARPRSGYFAKAPRSPVAAPELVRPRTGARKVEISDLAVEILSSLRDRDVVPLGSAFPDPALFPLETLARVMAARMRRLQPHRMVADLSPGNEDLRRQLALRYVNSGFAVPAQDIVVTSGAMEALTLCLQAVTAPGDLVAIESPAFYGCLQALDRLHLRALEVPTHPVDGVQVDELAKLLARHDVKACWFMPNFQNPTGYLMPDASKKKLVQLLARHRIPLIEDDVYAELYFGARRPLPAKAFDREGWVMHCSSFSKSLAPGYRLGWAAAGRFARDVERMKLMSTISVAVPSQLAVLDFLERAPLEKHLRALRTKLQARQDMAMSAVRRNFPAGTRVTQPQGGYFLWVQLPQHIDALKLHTQALSQGISTAPGHLFAPDARFGNFVRLNYGHAEPAQLQSAIKLLGRLCALAQQESTAGA
jgi:DNA-binding transcriptional MocR family regulator